MSVISPLRPRQQPLLLLLMAFAGWSMAYNLVLQWLPMVASARGAAPEAIGLLMAAGYAGSAFLGGASALLADRIGLRVVLLGFWGMGAVALLALTLRLPWAMTLAGNVLFMSGLGTLSVLSALTARWTPVGQERRGFGWLYAGGPLSLISASLLGGWLAERWEPVSTLWLALAAQTLAVAAVAALPSEPPRGSDSGPGALPHRRGAEEPMGEAGLKPRRKPQPPAAPWAFFAAAAVGYGFLYLPNSFTLLYANGYLGLRLMTGGLLHVVLGVSQLGWHLLLTHWPPPGPRLRLPVGLTLHRGLVVAVLIILGANGAAGILAALIPTGWAFALSLMLRGSLFSLQAIAATLLSQGTSRGTSTPFTTTALVGGMGVVAASAAGGVLYGWHPALPFAAAGMAGAGGALLGVLATRNSAARSSSREAAA